MTAILEVEDLTKVFVKNRSLQDLLLRPFVRARRRKAVEGVNLVVSEGEILGLLGPNGAGKTTLLKILTGLLLPTSGRARVAGFDVAHQPTRVRGAVGFVSSEERSFYWRLSGRENLHFFGRLSNLSGRRLRARCQELLEQVELADDADRAFMNYSSGMKQRLALARGLLHDPPVVIMDEPTRSLDPTSSRHLRRFVREELGARHGKTILLATHNLEEAESLCGRIAIMSRARIRRVGTVAEIRAAESPRDRYRLVLSGAFQPPGGAYEVRDEREVGGAARAFTLEVDRDGEGLSRFLAEALEAGRRVLSCERLEMPLQDVFDRVVEASSETDPGDAVS